VYLGLYFNSINLTIQQSDTPVTPDAQPPGKAQKLRPLCLSGWETGNHNMMFGPAFPNRDVG
jgi:hypothetical protein